MMNLSAQSPFETKLLRALSAGKLRIIGGDGDGNDGGNNDAGNGQAGESGKTENKSQPSGGSAEDKSKQNSDDGSGDRIKQLEADLDREKKDRIKLQRQLDKKDQEAQKDAENVEAERDDYKQKYEKLLNWVENTGIESAILKDKRFQWHDVEAVRTFIDRNNIRVDIDSNSVEGLDLELKRIAQDKPYLLVPKQNDSGQGSGNGQGSGQGNNQESPANGQPPSGSHPFGGNARQRETDKQKIGQKYKIPGYIASSNFRPV